MNLNERNERVKNIITLVEELINEFNEGSDVVDYACEQVDKLFDFLDDNFIDILSDCDEMKNDILNGFVDNNGGLENIDDEIRDLIYDVTLEIADFKFAEEEYNENNWEEFLDKLSDCEGYVDMDLNGSMGDVIFDLKDLKEELTELIDL